LEFVTGRYSGTGLEELAALIQAQAAAEPQGVTVVRFPFMGQAFVGVDIVLPESEAVQLEVLDPNEADLLAAIRAAAADRRALLVVTPPIEGNFLRALGHSFDALTEPAELIWEYPKPVDGSSIQLWDYGYAGRPAAAN
ncbi:MAG: hypothetical protein JXN59_05685, partial [Anaerolineae bacterium]|nr:hypothetical protein [Anaerolineae bacterium]